MVRFLASTLLVLLGTLFVPTLVLAQGVLTPSAQATLDLSERFPQPYEQVEATIRNEQSSAPGNLIWRINDQVDPAHNNQRTIQFEVGGPETPTVVEVYRGEQRLTRTTLTPRYTDIVVEPETYVPSFYPGRALPTAGSDMTLSVLLDGVSPQQANTYTYTWRVNNSVVDGGPVRGNTRTTVSVPNRSQVPVSVEVADTSGRVVAARSISVPIVRPTVHLYEHSSLYGLSTQAFERTVPMSGSSVSLEAVPYYLPLAALSGNPDISWRINREVVQSNTDSPFQITLQRAAAQGSERVDFSFRHPENTLFQAGKQFTVTY